MFLRSTEDRRMPLSRILIPIMLLALGCAAVAQMPPEERAVRLAYAKFGFYQRLGHVQRAAWEGVLGGWAPKRRPEDFVRIELARFAQLALPHGGNKAAFQQTTLQQLRQPSGVGLL